MPLIRPGVCSWWTGLLGLARFVSLRSCRKGRDKECVTVWEGWCSTEGCIVCCVRRNTCSCCVGGCSVKALSQLWRKGSAEGRVQGFVTVVKEGKCWRTCGRVCHRCEGREVLKDGLKVLSQFWRKGGVQGRDQGFVTVVQEGKYWRTGSESCIPVPLAHSIFHILCILSLCSSVFYIYFQENERSVSYDRRSVRIQK